MSSRKTKDEGQTRLNKAEDECSVIDALDALIPPANDTVRQVAAYGEHRDHQFIAQLKMLGAKIPLQMTAVRHYLQASKMRIRWKERNLKTSYIDRFRQGLFDIYDRHFEANKEGRASPVERGFRTLADTMKEANTSPSVKIPGTDKTIELPDGTIPGEYHHMANGEDGFEDEELDMEGFEINE